jgi:acetyl esterase/lipase
MHQWLRAVRAATGRWGIAVAFLLLSPAPVAGGADRLLAAADVAYGSDPLERADVYARPGLHGAPVAIFFHGGAYAFGDKNQCCGLWANVADLLAGAGFVAINADYRLSPRATWPAGLQDVGRVVAWARAHAASFGGDPRRIVLIGHSAGATHVAGYVLDRRFEPGGDPGVAGAILISGRYVLAPGKGDPNGRLVLGYFGHDPSALADRAPIAHVATAAPVKLLVVVAGRENAGLREAASALVAALCGRGECPAFARLKGESHVSEMADVGGADRVLSQLIVSFVRAAPR